ALAATGHRRAAGACALGWAAGTAEFARARIVPGPRTREEVTTMLVTSVAIPPAATWHRLAGAWRHRNAPAWRETVR
ncbi:transferase, partial [Streptomyces sp. SID7804]|nr:transferase [Streptomyces sp. SID7804]